MKKTFIFILAQLKICVGSAGLVMLISSVAHAGVMLQGFYWDADSSPQNSWWMQLANDSQALSRAGFTALWIPPVLKSASGGYSRGYDPYDDYDLGSKDQRDTMPTHWGSRDELQRMVAQARANGMQVLLDLNVSHRAGDSGDKKYLYKNAYGELGQGRFQKGPGDFGADFPFGRLFNFDSTYVRDGLKEAGEWLTKSLGTQGFRIDSVKHIPADFLSDYLRHGELQKQFAVVEYWEGPDALYDYVINGLNSRAAAFDFPTWSTLREMGNEAGLFDMRRLVKPGLLGRAPELAVTFAENDDTDRGFPTQRNKHLSYAFILTSEGYPSVYWKDYAVYGMKDLIDNLIWIHEALARGGTENRWADDDFLVYERMGEPGVLVGMNDNQRSARTEWVQTHFGPNVELHDYAGNQGPVRTDQSGKVRITVPANDYVAYSVSNVQYEHPLVRYRTVQEFFGAADLDILPARNNEMNKVGSIFVEGGSRLEWEITYEHKDWNENARFMMEILGPSGEVIAQNMYGNSIGVAKGSVDVPATGWYRLNAGGENMPAPTKFWWKQAYQAPR
jgi:alpha-amylase